MPSLTNIESNFLAFDSMRIECGVSHSTYESNTAHFIRYRIERAQAFDRKSIDLVERVTRFAETHARLVLASLLEPVNRPLAVPDATERDLSS
jgi:hypothetical protein